MSGRAEPIALVVDVGGTSFKGALVDRQGRTIFQSTAVLGGQTGEPAFDRLRDLCRTLHATATEGGLSPVAAGIVAPGIDDATGRVMFSSNLAWRDLPLRDRLQADLQMPVAAGHDVRTAGLAEGLLGAGRGTRDFALVMIGTGIAAALMANGAIIAGARNMGGEFGHMPVHPDGETCACGQAGCLETYGSAASIARRYRALGGATPLSAAEIATRQGEDVLATRVWTDAVEALALGLTTLVMTMDPALFVLGGGLVEAGPVLLDPLAASLDRRLTWRSAPPIRRASLGLSVGRLGAAILAYRQAGMADIIDDWRP